jgi:hypothetical protein
VTARGRTWRRRAHLELARHKRKTPTCAGVLRMELAGLEPATSCMPCRQPSSLSLACLQGISASSDGTTVGRFFAQFPPIPPGIGPTDALFGPILSSAGSARGSQQFGAFELDGGGRASATSTPAQAQGMSCPTAAPTGCATTPTSALAGRHAEAWRGARNADDGRAVAPPLTAPTALAASREAPWRLVGRGAGRRARARRRRR